MRSTSKFPGSLKIYRLSTAEFVCGNAFPNTSIWIKLSIQLSCRLKIVVDNNLTRLWRPLNLTNVSVHF